MLRNPKKKWMFAPRFRRNAFGWRSLPAITRVKEAVAEIRKVARKDPTLAAEGAVLFLTKVSAALARASQRNDDILSGTEITETASTVPNLATQLRVEALQIMFTNVSLLLNSFHNMMLMQAGRDPVPPILPDFGGGLGGFAQSIPPS